jgi:hypothetical protein
MWGIAARQPKNTPSASVAITFRHCASVMIFSGSPPSLTPERRRGLWL